jgi:hypothetical protein
MGVLPRQLIQLAVYPHPPLFALRLIRLFLPRKRQEHTRWQINETALPLMLMRPEDGLVFGGIFGKRI